MELSELPIISDTAFSTDLLHELPSSTPLQIESPKHKYNTCSTIKIPVASGTITIKRPVTSAPKQPLSERLFYSEKSDENATRFIEKSAAIASDNAYQVFRPSPDLTSQTFRMWAGESKPGWVIEMISPKTKGRNISRPYKINSRGEKTWKFVDESERPRPTGTRGAGPVKCNVTSWEDIDSLY